MRRFTSLAKLNREATERQAQNRHAKEEEHKANINWRNPINWNWTAISTCVIACFTILIYYVGVNQWHTFQGQLNVMQGQLDEMRSPSAERPYLFIAHDDSKPPDPSEPVTPGKVYLVLFKNYGKTPAMYRGLQPRCGYFKTNPPAITFTNDKWASSVIVGPNETIGPLECPLVAGTEEIALAEKNVGFLFLAGKIIYDDLAGLPHETVFCLIYKPDTKRFGLVPNDNSCNYYK
jgi:hypothetical protein